MFPVADDVPRRNVPLATWALIALNAWAFLVELRLPEIELRRLLFTYGIVPARLTNAPFSLDSVWPFFTSQFLHGGWLHLIGNMWMLWIFGDNVEDRLGSGRFLLFYGTCGVVASALHVATNASSPIPTIGASGAIAGVLGAYFLLFPRARVLTVFPILFYPVFLVLPALVFLGLWFGLQFWSGALALGAESDSGGIAWWAHIGGFVAGLTLLRLFARPRELRRKHRDARWNKRAWNWQTPPRRRY